MNYKLLDTLNEFNVEFDPDSGDFMYCKRQYTLNNNFDFTGKEFITSTADVAFILKNLQHYGVEHSFACFVLSDHSCVIQQLGMGDFCSCVVNLDILRFTALQLNAEDVYLAHNHPSGSLKFSLQDKIMHKACSRVLGDMYKGSILINTTSGNFAFIRDASNKERIESIPDPELTDIKIDVIQFSKQVFSHDFTYRKAFTVTGPDDIAKFISSQKFGKRNKAGMLIMNKAMIIVANLHLPFSRIMEASIPDIASYMQKCITAFGGTDTIVYYTGTLSKRMMQLLKNEFNKVSRHTLCDVCYDFNNGMKSGLSEGYLNETSLSKVYKSKLVKL